VPRGAEKRMTKPFRIALIMQGGRGWVGGMEYIRNIILALSSLPPAARNTFEISLLVNTLTDQYFIESVKPYLKKVYVVDELVPPTVFKTVKRVAIRYLFSMSDGRYDVILDKNNFDFVYPYTSSDCGFSLKKVTAWIYDFQHKYLTDLFSEHEIKIRDKEFAHMAQHASLIILSSRSAEADFKKFYPQAASKTKVLTFKVIPQSTWYELDPLDIQHKYYLPDKFFIISNQFWQHKDHLTVFRALKLLKDKGIKPIVICTGHIYDHRQPEYSDIIFHTIHTLGLMQQVYVLGLIPKIDQIQLLRRSIALIQPSLFEGWSTVVEDARCMGKPAILSNFPVHLEQNLPNSRFFDRTSPESLAPVMADYWKSLSPGPDLEQESIASINNKNEVQDFANNFLRIARRQ
jgi:glycosyltransferase involved in cell wall biosynthesis